MAYSNRLENFSPHFPKSSADKENPEFDNNGIPSSNHELMGNGVWTPMLHRCCS